MGRSSELKTLKFVKKVKWGPTDRPTDQPLDGWTDGRTKQGLESRSTQQTRHLKGTDDYDMAIQKYIIDVRDLHVLENIGMSFHFKFAANPILSFGLRSGLGAEPKGLPSVITKDDVSKLCQEKLP